MLMLRQMARKYLVLQQEIFNLRKNKIALQEKLSQAEKLEQLGNQRYQDKIRELENKRVRLFFIVDFLPLFLILIFFVNIVCWERFFALLLCLLWKF